MRKFIEKCSLKIANAKFRKNDLKFFTYLKFSIVILASWFLFGEKMIALFMETSSTPWIALTVYIVGLAILTVYQKRKAIRILISTESRRTGLGMILFTFFVISYVSNAYLMEGMFNILLTGSFSLFLASILTFAFDYRIPRDLTIIFVSLSFVFLPLKGYESWSLLTTVLSYIIAASVLGILVIIAAKSFRKEEEDCPLCRLTSQETDSCLYCGRKNSAQARNKSRKTSVVVTVLAVSAILLMNLAAIPTLYMTTEQGSLLELYTMQGREYGSAVQLPSDYVLISSQRLLAYENQTSEELAFLTDYQKGENVVSVLLEVNQTDPYFMNSWQLPGWKYEKIEDNVDLTETVKGKSYSLRRENNSLAVLRTVVLTLTFKEDTFYVSKKAGVSVYINFSRRINDLELFPALNLLEETCVLVIRRLFVASEWTNRLYALNQVFDSFKDYLLSSGAILVFFAFAALARHNDHCRERTVENALSSSAEEVKLIEAIQRLKKRKFTGQQLFRAYATKEEKQPVEDFVGKLKLLEEKGILRRDLVISGRELITVWVSAL